MTSNNKKIIIGTINGFIIGSRLVSVINNGPEPVSFLLIIFAVLIIVLELEVI
ncbi:MAG: hypothetical protein ACOCRO_07285 [Halanaerobiales bacterium]